MWRKILSTYNNSKFRTKLFLIFALSSILPICTILFISAEVNERNLTEKVNQLMVTNLRQIAERVNVNMEVYTNLLYQMYQDEQITDNIKKLMDDTSTGKAVAYNKILERLKQFNTAETGVRCISVICADGNAVVSDFETSSYVENLWTDYKDMRTILPFVESLDEAGMVITPTMIFQERNSRKHYFHISKRMFDFDNLDQGSIATIVMTVDAGVLNQICNAVQSEHADSSINFIMAPDDTVITYPDEDFSGIKKNPRLTVAEFVEVSGLLRNRQTAVNIYQDPVTGWGFYNVYDRDYMLADVVTAQRMYMLIGVVALVAASVLIFCLVKQINQSVHYVVRGMKEVQGGNLDVKVPVTQNDEIGEIAENFNHMTKKVKLLITEVKDATDKQKNAEIQALEAQINPHFLYNTLDSINWMAIDRGEYEISKMLRDLGVILRYSVNKSNAVVTIDEIEDWLDKYINLHRVRFDHVFDYQIHVAREAREKRMHKLLLQPFIENAILHGFRELEGGGVLRVDISLSADSSMLDIIIEDNGKGMPEEFLKQYNDPKKAIEDDGRSIGLHNTFSRMHIYYGNAVRWNVRSMDGMGTVFTLKIPVLNGEEAYEDTNRRR